MAGVDSKGTAEAGRQQLSHLSADNPLWRDRTQVEIVSSSYDADLMGIGSSPWVGEASSVGITVPQVATPSQRERYLFRLASCQIPKGSGVVIKGLRQLATLRAVSVSAGDGCQGVPVEREVVSPGWHFQDGNISWHLRWEDYSAPRGAVYDADQIIGTSPNVGGQDSVLLYVPPLLPYVPPGAGIPAGRSVDFLGTWRDMRYPWGRTSWDLSIPVKGPGRIVFYASVHQTDPATRCQLLIPALGMVGLRPEDQFVASYEAEEIAVLYGRVAGALALDLMPASEVSR